ncbi:TackOD1 domain-containing metal-binding protein [Nitratifractor sp.]
MEYILIEEHKTSIELNFPYKKVKRSEINNELKAPEAFIILGNSEEFFEAICRDIRNLSAPKVYLKPIIFLTEDKLSPRVSAMADSVISTPELASDAFKIELKKIDKINDAIRKIDPTEEEIGVDRFLKVLRFLVTRNKRIEPVRDRTSFFGLSYPSLECFFSKNDYELYNTLDFLEKNGSIEGDFFEKIHLCNRCFCGFLNFIEVCPNCGSSDLVEESLIHHFPCAYVGPESDFMKEGQLICPKCNKKLEALGVDYDKPADIYRCNKCGFIAQEPDVKAICNNCEKESLPEDLILQTIKIYKVTSLGENFAIYGFESPLLKPLQKQLNILPYNLFSNLIQIELERAKRYGVESSILAFNIANLHDIYVKLGKNIDMLLKEIGALIMIMMETRKCDILTVLNEGTVLLLLPNTPPQGAEVAKNRLVSQIQNLIKENVGIEPVIKSTILWISQRNTKHSDELIEELLNNLKSDQDKE